MDRAQWAAVSASVALTDSHQVVGPELARQESSSDLRGHCWSGAQQVAQQDQVGVHPPCVGVLKAGFVEQRQDHQPQLGCVV